MASSETRRFCSVLGCDAVTADCVIENVTVTYGAICALDGVSIELSCDEIAGIIGPNGSGKTTLFNAITGLVRPSSGHIYWSGRDISRWRTDRIARAGLVRTFQQSTFFPSATVAENIELAQAAGFRNSGRNRRPISVSEILDRVGLQDMADDPASVLSFGHKRKLALAMVMTASPRLVLLDEPSAGLNDVETQDIAETLRHMAAEGMGVVVVDHDMPFVMGIAARTIVLDAGKKLAEGTPQEVSADPTVITAYLGPSVPVRRTESAARLKGLSRESIVLAAKNIGVEYGSVVAVRNVSLDLREGESLAVLGANGVGKTSLLRAVCRLTSASGSVSLSGRELKADGASAARSGLVHVLEGRHIFTNMTVAENLRVGLARQNGLLLDDVLEMFPLLKTRLSMLGGALSGGQQQSLAIARALMHRPRVLVLDEPTLGLSPVAITGLIDSIRRIRDEWGTSLLIAEQSVNLALAVSDRYVVMRRGEIISDGRSESVSAGDEMFMAYLGHALPESPGGSYD
jgi:branched-chain amino acid transport system ATP-binding protein